MGKMEEEANAMGKAQVMTHVGSAAGLAGVLPQRTEVLWPSMCTRTLMASDRSTCSLVTESPSPSSSGLQPLKQD